VSNWTFDVDSTLDGAFINDLTGDTLTLNGLDGMAITEDPEDAWTLFGNTTNFEFGSTLNITDFGSIAMIDNAFTFSDSTYEYVLAINDDANKSMTLSKSVKPTETEYV